MRTRASVDPEEELFVRPKSTLLASMSVLHCIPGAHHASSFSAFSTIFDFWPCCKSKASKVVYPNAHSSECRSRGEVVCWPEKHVACVDVSVALHPGGASRARSQPFRPFLTFVLCKKKQHMLSPFESSLQTNGVPSLSECLRAYDFPFSNG